MTLRSLLLRLIPHRHYQTTRLTLSCPCRAEEMTTDLLRPFTTARRVVPTGLPCPMCATQTPGWMDLSRSFDIPGGPISTSNAGGANKSADISKELSQEADAGARPRSREVQLQRIETRG